MTYAHLLVQRIRAEGANPQSQVATSEQVDAAQTMIHITSTKCQ